MMYTKMQTRWEANEDHDLVHVGSGDPAWRTITENASEFPMRADKVATLMNHAFRIGAEAKLAEIRSVLNGTPA